MAVKKIAVDAGRSAIKYAILNDNNEIKTGLISSKLGILNMSNLRMNQYPLFNKNDDIICKVDDSKILAMGETCEMLLTPNEIKYPTDDDMFIKYSIYYTLVSIAKVVDNNDNKKVRCTLSQLEGILKGDTLKQNNMNTNSISRTDLGKIHNIACATWKTKLEKLGSRNPFSGTIELTQSELDEMFKAATPDQRPTLVNIFGEQSNSVDLTELNDIKYEINDNDLLAVRVRGEYRDKGFYLNDDYNWEIVKDNYGILVLIPTRK
jgi:hypothetical protein